MFLCCFRLLPERDDDDEEAPPSFLGADSRRLRRDAAASAAGQNSQCSGNYMKDTSPMRNILDGMKKHDT